MDAAMYKDILVNRGGLQAIRDYYDDLQEKIRAADASMASARRSARATDKIRPRCKEDGAPGHGFNNKAKAANGSHGVGNATHDEIVAEAGTWRASRSFDVLLLLRRLAGSGADMHTYLPSTTAEQKRQRLISWPPTSPP